MIYTCVGTLAITGHLHYIDADRLGWWLAERQLDSGGNLHYFLVGMLNYETLISRLQFRFLHFNKFQDINLLISRLNIIFNSRSINVFLGLNVSFLV